MMRPPRPKYPSDSKNFHEVRRPGYAHTIRLPEELPSKYSEPDECSDGENADVLAVLDVADSEDDKVMCLDSQAPSSSRDAAGRTYPDATTAFWSKEKVLEVFQRFMMFCPRGTQFFVIDR
ncbi:hypothetical protein R1sor_011094 [Riccia sorocarpa]|uniref:Uncharacterized protein n=1 Tax=Riccia sorocarpa TaxID=122646 RepID=A0ABD3HZW7_9MARC